MNFFASPVAFRLLLALLLLAELPGCKVYDRIFHPYRLGTPEPSPEFKKQQKAKELKAKEGSKAAKAAQKAKGKSTETVEASSADSAPSADAAAPDEKSALPEKHKKVKYDKQGLMKKPKLLHRRIHKPVSKGFHPIDSFKNLFRGKPKDKPSGKGKDKDPADAPAAPDADFPGGK